MIWESSRDLNGKSDRDSGSASTAKQSEGKAGPKAAKATGSGGLKWDRRTLRFGIVGFTALVALIAWLATRGGGEDSPEPVATEPGPPRIVNVGELREAAAALGQPIYWAGPVPGTELELIELPEAGGVQVLYLGEGAEPVEPEPGSAKWLTVGSYPLADAQGQLEGYAERPESIVRHSGDGRLVVSSQKAPSSAYFVSSEGSVQVEVYNPSPQQAMKLALSGKVEPAG